MEFSAGDGRYGIYITCATGAEGQGGDVQPSPGPETAPQLVLTIDTTDPVVELEPLERTLVRSGSIMRIAWKVTEINPDPTGLTLLHSRDDGETWEPLAAGLDPGRMASNLT